MMRMRPPNLPPSTPPKHPASIQHIEPYGDSIDISMEPSGLDAGLDAGAGDGPIQPSARPRDWSVLGGWGGYPARHPAQDKYLNYL